MPIPSPNSMNISHSVRAHARAIGMETKTISLDSSSSMAMTSQDHVPSVVFSPSKTSLVSEVFCTLFCSLPSSSLHTNVYCNVSSTSSSSATTEHVKSSFCARGDSGDEYNSDISGTEFAMLIVWRVCSSPSTKPSCVVTRA